MTIPPEEHPPSHTIAGLKIIEPDLTPRQYLLWTRMMDAHMDAYQTGTLGNGRCRIVLPELANPLDESAKQDLVTDLRTLTNTPIKFLATQGGEPLRGSAFISQFSVDDDAVEFQLPTFLRELLE